RWSYFSDFRVRYSKDGAVLGTETVGVHNSESMMRRNVAASRYPHRFRWFARELAIGSVEMDVLLRMLLMSMAAVNSNDPDTSGSERMAYRKRLTRGFDNY